MESVHVPTPACNAVSPLPIQAPPPAARDAEDFSGEFTEEKFRLWLDAHPGRRREYDKGTAEEQAESRQRTARLWALRTSPMAGELAQATNLAHELATLLRGIVSRYAPLEAARVLASFGLTSPSPDDECQAWQDDHFVQARRKCRRLAIKLDNFQRYIWGEISLLVPDAEKGRAA